MKILQTERTAVRRISLDDAAFIATLVNSKDWLRFIGNRQVEMLEDAERFLQAGFLRSYLDNGFSYYLVSTHNNIPIGISGFLKKPHLENPDFGFAFLPEYCGKGFGLESSQAILNYGIATFNLSTIDAEVSKDNVRSISLLTRLGFSQVDCELQSEDGVLVYRFDVR